MGATARLTAWTVRYLKRKAVAIAFVLVSPFILMADLTYLACLAVMRYTIGGGGEAFREDVSRAGGRWKRWGRQYILRGAGVFD